jgi:tripartite-type tricarboxylate transporter receptor subunit TctC
MIRRSRALVSLWGAWIVLVGAAPACAQAEFPTRPIKLVVPFPAGGGIDVTAQIAAQALGDVLASRSWCRTKAEPVARSQRIPL